MYDEYEIDTLEHWLFESKQLGVPFASDCPTNFRKKVLVDISMRLDNIDEWRNHLASFNFDDFSDEEDRVFLAYSFYRWGSVAQLDHRFEARRPNFPSRDHVLSLMYELGALRHDYQKSRLTTQLQDFVNIHKDIIRDVLAYWPTDPWIDTYIEASLHEDPKAYLIAFAKKFYDCDDVQTKYYFELFSLCHNYDSTITYSTEDSRMIHQKVLSDWIEFMNASVKTPKPSIEVPIFDETPVV